LANHELCGYRGPPGAHPQAVRGRQHAHARRGQLRGLPGHRRQLRVVDAYGQLVVLLDLLDKVV
jgi:hypothetical protein